MTETNNEARGFRDAEQLAAVSDYLRAQTLRRWAWAGAAKRREIEADLGISPQQAYAAVVALIAPPRVRGPEQETAL